MSSPTAPSSAAPRRSSSSGSWTSRVTQVRVADARAAMAPIAVRFWDDPTAQLRVAGVTGTNGKTTTAFLIRHVLESHGTRTGLLGTVKRIVGGVEEEVERTTPEAIDLQRTFRRMLDAGDEACAMEVSSHALALERTAGVRFAVAVFTNLTQDHLDFHADMEEYFLAKRSCFPRRSLTALPRGSPGGVETAVVNVDDPYGARLAAELREAGEPPLLTFSPSGAEGADFRAVDVSFDATGSRFRCLAPGGEVEVRMPLPGHFNVENALAAIGACHALGVPADAAAAALASAGRVPGRFEPVDEGQPFAVLVDYAHTPDSLENALERGAQADRGTVDRGLRVRRRSRPREAPPDGGDRGPALGRLRGHLGQPALRGAEGDHRRDPGWNDRRRGLGRSRWSPTAEPRSRSRSRPRRRATRW